MIALSPTTRGQSGPGAEEGIYDYSIADGELIVLGIDRSVHAISGTTCSGTSDHEDGHSRRSRIGGILPELEDATDLERVMKQSDDQPSLFDDRKPAPATPTRLLPEGFRYRPDVISVSEELELVRQIKPLPFKEFEFQGYTGKRRVVSFGWRYDFNERELQGANEIPAFLLPLRERAAEFAGLGPNDLQHVLVTEYAPSAAIGWHRDKAVFAEVVGFSLLSACKFRLRRKVGEKYERVTIDAQPRSAYLLSGPSRTEWEHSIPGVEQLRYSITFRNFRVER